MRAALADDNGDFDGLTGIPYREDWQVSVVEAPCVVCSIGLEVSEPRRNHTAKATVSFTLMLPFHDYSDDEARGLAERFHARLASAEIAGTSGDSAAVYSFDWSATDAPDVDSETGSRSFTTSFDALVQY